jgi:hypothetical protein
MAQARQSAPRLLFIAVTEMSVILFYVICVSIGLAIDWALYERVTLYVEALKHVEAKRRYKDVLFPRILVTILGLSMIAFDPYVSSDHEMLLWIGLALFLISITYLLIMAYRPMRDGHS